MASTSATVDPLRRLLAIAGIAAVLLAFALADTEAADAHGSTTDPPSRVYGCFDRWADDFQNPAMATEDPMCWQAWQADPTAMWNWNALSRLGVGGEYEATIPDGQLCSGGLTKDGRYAAFDEPGPWRAVTKPRQFTLTVTDEIPHGADYLRVYITKQGFDPTTQPLRWSDLELVSTTGPQPAAGGIYQAQVDAGNRTGHHIVYAIWLAAHQDESYYMCSDVDFQGGTTPPSTPNPSPPPTTSPSPTAPPPTAGTCRLDYAVNAWNTGLTASITITNTGSSAINGWLLDFTLPSGQTITNGWNATYAPTSGAVTASNAAWNATISPGASVSVGFQATHTGDAGEPTSFALNGTACAST